MARPRREDSVSRSIVVRFSESEISNILEAQKMGYWNNRSEFLREAVEHYILYLKSNKTKSD